MKIEQVHTVGANTTSGTMTAVLAGYQARDVAEHPLFEAMAAREPDLRAMWAIVHNFREGISKHLVRWLAGVLYRSETAVQVILVTMLYDELGSGLRGQVHADLLDRWYGSLRRWEFGGDADALIAPGRRLALQLEGTFANADVNIGLAAVMVAEVFAEKFDKCLLKEMRRTTEVSDRDMAWLILHCTVEEAHAAAAVELAKLIDTSGITGAELAIAAACTWGAFYQYLDDVHAVLRTELWQDPSPCVA
jgi:pyrroloquinoline quinone (PQQ) biosynthesis protein C